mmetsp:Transcript_6373/g.15405  ORF Transcript_6373/g.15405 Transcript_6373/m.15405 type:complete len:87 (+) Transcript_6373:43-303(+)
MPSHFLIQNENESDWCVPADNRLAVRSNLARASRIESTRFTGASGRDLKQTVEHSQRLNAFRAFRAKAAFLNFPPTLLISPTQFSS